VVDEQGQDEVVYGEACLALEKPVAGP